MSIRVGTETYRLIHYTSSAQVLASIAENGFLLIPNKRHLINALLGEQLFSDREPQEFGMVSFTQLSVDVGAVHREHFGAFGIAPTWEWALRNGAQRVIYVDESGPIAETFAWLFRLAKQELDRASAGKPSRMTLENKAMAFSAASTMYAHLLSLYEYMEPERNSAQVEWRIVNKLPQYHRVSSRQELIAEMLATVKLLKNFGSVAVTPNDLHTFICPRDERSRVIEMLPADFRKVPILTYRSHAKMTRLQRARDRALFVHRGRERIVTVTVAPPKNALYLSTNSDGAYHLPEVATIWGARLYQDELISGIRALIQYQSRTGFLCDLVMPILDALYLLNLLKALQDRSGLDPLNPSDDSGGPSQPF